MILKHTTTALLLVLGGAAYGQSVTNDVDFSGMAVQGDVKLQCTFTTECIDAEACADTTFGGALIGKSGGTQADDMALVATLQSDGGDQEFVGSFSGGAYKMMNIIGSANHMMTVAPDGTAHYSLHMPDVPMAITYIGTCEDAK